MSAYCERCGREWKHIPDDHAAPGFSCKTCKPAPRPTLRDFLNLCDSKLEAFVWWIDYRATFLEWLATWAAIIVAGIFLLATTLTLAFIGIRAWVMFLMGLFE